MFHSYLVPLIKPRPNFENSCRKHVYDKSAATCTWSGWLKITPNSFIVESPFLLIEHVKKKRKRKVKTR